VLLAPPGANASPADLLREQAYIRYDPNAWGGRYAAAWLADQGIMPTLLCDLDALEAIALLVADGMGVSLVPQWRGIERFAGDCRKVAIPGPAYAREMLMLRPVETDCAAMLDVLEQGLTRA